MNQDEPPSAQPCQHSSRFFVGRNSRGNWVVQEQSGLCGGLFIGRAEAVRFALFETGNRPEAIVIVTGPFELNISGPVAAPQVQAEPPALQRAA